MSPHDGSDAIRRRDHAVRLRVAHGCREWTPVVMSTEGRSLKNPEEGARKRAERSERRLPERSISNKVG